MPGQRQPDIAVRLRAGGEGLAVEQPVHRADEETAKSRRIRLTTNAPTRRPLIVKKSDETTQTVAAPSAANSPR
jgi:hypothetical protein